MPLVFSVNYLSLAGGDTSQGGLPWAMLAYRQVGPTAHMKQSNHLEFPLRFSGELFN